MRDQISRVEKCRTGKCGTGKCRTENAGVENARLENAGPLALALKNKTKNVAMHRLVTFMLSDVAVVAYLTFL